MRVLDALVSVVLVCLSHGQVIHPPDDVEAYLIFTSNYRIVRFNVDVTDARVLQQDTHDTIALDFHYDTGYYYWSDQEDKKIYRARLEGGQSELVISTGDSSVVDGIGVDWINNKLYWTDLPFGTINRIDLDGYTNRVVIIASGIFNPRGIVLDPINDMMYYTDVYTWAPQIQRARMSDGTQQETIVQTGLVRPNAITMDYDTQKLYFADAITDKIESCNTDGSNRRTLLNRRQSFHPFDLTLYDDRIYWTDLWQHTIVSAHKDTGGDRLRIFGPFIYPYVIHAVHPSRQRPRTVNHCAANGGRGECEAICTSHLTGYSCSCQNGYMLNADQHTCSDLNECVVNNGGCSHVCQNEEGTFHCTCIDGFMLLPDGVTCVDKNECNQNKGGCQYACHNTDSGYYCSCPTGYELGSDQHTCQDVNECLLSSPCPAEAQCSNHDGSYRCICRDGFTYDAISQSCQDVNECLSGQSTCTHRCHNEPGTFSCSCHDGFSLDADGVTCTDIDECQDNLDGCQQHCVNIVGSFVCLCYDGYRLLDDGHSCAPINCGQPSDIDGFNISCTNTTFGSVCTLSCIQGTIFGVSSITCQMNSLWSISTSECLAVNDTQEGNDPPHAIVPTTFSIPEDSASGVVLGTLHTVDADNHESYTYTLTSDSSGKFYIDSDRLATMGGLDFEMDPAYIIRVTTTDSGSPPLSASFDLSIAVLDVNEQPSQPTLTYNTIGEHASVGDPVGRVTSSDPDHGQTETFSLLSSGRGKFRLQGDRLLVAAALNFEEDPTYTIVIQVEDNGVPKQTNVATFVVNIQDQNDAPTSVSLSSSEVSEVSPDSATTIGTVIGLLVTEDEDANDTHTYNLGGSRTSCFTVDAANLVVASAACFDHETNPSISVVVTSTDPSGLSVQQTFTITIADVNEPPSQIILSSATIQEHVAINTVVGTLTVLDLDVGDTHQLVTNSSTFAVQGGALVVIADLDFTDYPTGIEVTVQATDLANHMHVQTFTIIVQNVNEPPNDITWSVAYMCSQTDESVNGLNIHACVVENTPQDTVIATAMATDPDLDTLTLSILDSGNIFKLDQTGALKVGNQGLNYESPLVGQVHSVTVEAGDPGGLTSSSQFNIKILNANDPPATVEISKTYVGQGTAVGQSAAVLRCIDEDVQDTHSFVLVDNADGKFAIIGNQLQVNQDLSALAGNQFPVSVQCSDGLASLAMPVTFVMTVFDDGSSTGGDANIIINLNNSHIAEGQPANTLVGTLNAVITPTTDVNFAIVGGASQLFTIQPGVAGRPAELRTSQPLDYEETSVHYIIVRAQAGGNSAVKTFTISVIDLNEPPVNLMFHYHPVHENQQGALVGVVSAVDPEGAAVSFLIANNPSDAFELQVGATANSRRLVTKRPLDFETESSLTVVLAARDSVSPTLISDEAFYTVYVLNVNEAPTGIQISRSDIDENQPQGAIVGTLSVDDPDSSHTPQEFSCFLQNSASGLFQVDGLDIKVFQSSRLDYESFAASNTKPTIVVECSDAGGLTVGQSFEITVRNVAEPPTDVRSVTGVFEVQENNAGGAVVAHLHTIDQDTDDQSTFQYTVSDPGTFAITGQMLTALIQLNYERQNHYDISITTTDEDGLPFTKGVTVIVLNGNDPPTGIILTQSIALSAQAQSGTIIGTLEAVDEDVGQSHQFQIQTQTPAQALQITDSNKLAVDMGTQQAYSVSVTIVVTDMGVVTPLDHVQTFTIDVTDVNLPPTGMHLNGSSVLEGSAVGTVVGTLQIQDPSNANEIFYCVLLDDAGGRFDLVRVGSHIQLQVAYSEGLNYETSQSHAIRISCRDSLPTNVIEETFVIDILDGPEKPTSIVFTNAAAGDTTTNVNPPNLDSWQGQVITLATATVYESAENGVVIVAYLTLIAADGRPASDQGSHLLELISENEYNRLNRLSRRRRDVTSSHDRFKRSTSTNPSTVPSEFTVSSTGQYILVNGALDYETQTDYVLFVKASDSANPSLVVTGRVLVIILNIDEAPLDMSLSTSTIREDVPVDTLVGYLSVDDPDGTHSAYAYTQVSLGTPFYLQQQQVLVQRPLDHEVAPIVTIQVRVSEVNTNLELIKNFHIMVTDAPEPPTALTVDGNTTLIIPEILEVSDIVGTFVVTDPDTASGFSFRFFVDEDSHYYFSITGDGRLMLARRLDAWMTNVLSLFVQVTDPTNLSFRQVITIRVTSDDRCSRPGYCSPYATCLRGFCKCSPGFSGNGFTCIDVNECSSYPCSPDHSLPDTCQNGLGGIRNFTCDCLPGWTGRDCSIEVDSCQDNQCSPLGTVRCVNIANSVNYRCECRRGFQGTLCDGNVDNCIQHQCQNGGTCVDGIGIYTCGCTKPFEGFFCELDPTVCNAARCEHGGLCNPLPGGRYGCRCVEPFLPDCSGCAFGYGGKNCTPCEPPFTGANCDIDSSVCDPNPCPNDGVCIPDTDKYSCVCPANQVSDLCKPLVVPLQKPPPTGDKANPSWIVALCVSVVVILVIAGLICLAIRRLNRKMLLVPGRARFLSSSEQVIVNAEHPIPVRDYPLGNAGDPVHGFQRDYPKRDYPERDYPKDVERDPHLQRFPPAAAREEDTPHVSSAEQGDVKQGENKGKQEPDEKPPPYSPPDNLFFAQAVGLLPPGYQVDLGKQNGTPDEKKKQDLEGDLAVAQLVETLATPYQDRGPLQAKSSNLDDWERDQMGLVLEKVPEEGDRKKVTRKKSDGRKLSVSRKLSVGAVAYPSPMYIPDNKVLSQQAAMEIQQEARPSGIPDSNSSTPSLVNGIPELGGQGGVRTDSASDVKRRERPSVSQNDVTKQNPVFQESDNEDEEDDAVFGEETSG